MMSQMSACGSEKSFVESKDPGSQESQSQQISGQKDAVENKDGGDQKNQPSNR